LVIKARQGAKKAMIAVGHALLVICYHVLDRGKAYQELGETYFDERQRQTVEKRLVQRLEKLGYEVSLQPVTQAT
jgi:transposase